MNKTRILSLLSIYLALGVLVSPIFYVDLGFAKVFPMQHLLNVCLAVWFGTRYNLMGAFALSSLRILLGLGTIMAYPGSLFGAFLSAYFYEKTQSLWMASIGEVVGTGLIGSLVAYAIASYVLGSSLGAIAFVLPFVLSSLTGALLAQVILRYGQKLFPKLKGGQ